jgi:hypothetical protein
MRRFLMITSGVAAVVLATSNPVPAGEKPSYVELLANCRRLIVAGVDSPGCAAIVARRDAEPRPYTGSVDLTLQTYSTDSKEYMAQRRAESSERIAKARTDAAERMARERNLTAERVATEHSRAVVGAAAINAARRR